MQYEVNGKMYDVEIIKKNNKNTYIKIKDDLTIYVTTNYLVSNSSIKKLLDENYNFLCRAILAKEKKAIKDSKFYLLGRPYEVIIDDKINKIYLEGNKIYVKSSDDLNKWLNKEIKRIYLEHLDYYYQKFEEEIPYPKLKIRKMKTRWGVCNKKDKSVTLNSLLIKYPYDKLDYVIVHELSHFIHFNHSKEFWQLVSKYCPKYKQIRKELKE